MGYTMNQFTIKTLDDFEALKTAIISEFLKYGKLHIEETPLKVYIGGTKEKVTVELERSICNDRK